METINDRIKKIRLDKMLSQKDLSEMVGLTGSHYSKVEKNMYHLDTKQTQILIEKLNVNPMWLFTGIGNMYMNIEALPERMEEYIATKTLELNRREEELKKMAELVDKDEAIISDLQTEIKTLRARLDESRHTIEYLLTLKIT